MLSKKKYSISFMFLVLLYAVSALPYIGEIMLPRQYLPPIEIIAVVLWLAIIFLEKIFFINYKIPLVYLFPSAIVCILPLSTRLFVYCCWYFHGFAP